MMRDVYSLRDQLNLLDYDSAITHEDFKAIFRRTKEKASFIFNGRNKVRTASVYRTSIPGYEDVRFVKVGSQLHYIDETGGTDDNSPADTQWLVDVLKAMPKASTEKEITIATHRRGFLGREDRVSTVTGTLSYLREYFGYTLECGRRKVNMDPKTGKSLVTALNNAKTNTARNGYSDTWFELVKTRTPKWQEIAGIDEYTKLAQAEQTCHTIEIGEKATGKEGVANTCPDGVQVFYGADDGSEDKTVSAEDFNRHFEITAMLNR